MTTAADGAEGFYTSENNPSRMEGVEEAKILDKKIREAWLGECQVFPKISFLVSLLVP